MSRKMKYNYLEAALTVLQELGGGPISTKTLITAAKERGLLGNKKWDSNHFSRKVRESKLFDTSVRGRVRLAKNFEPSVEEPVADASLPVKEVLDVEPQKETFPGPTLGGSVAN
jgi:hypothetical protein